MLGKRPLSWRPPGSGRARPGPVSVGPDSDSSSEQSTLFPRAGEIRRWNSRSLATRSSTSGSGPEAVQQLTQARRSRPRRCVPPPSPWPPAPGCAATSRNSSTVAVAMEIHDEAERLEQQRGLQAGHVGAVTAPHVQDVHQRQGLDRLAQRTARQAEFGGQIGFPGQPVAGLQRAGDDHGLDLLDGLVGQRHSRPPNPPDLLRRCPGRAPVDAYRRVFHRPTVQAEVPGPRPVPVYRCARTASAFGPASGARVPAERVPSGLVRTAAHGVSPA